MCSARAKRVPGACLAHPSNTHPSQPNQHHNPHPLSQHLCADEGSPSRKLRITSNRGTGVNHSQLHPTLLLITRSQVDCFAVNSASLRQVVALRAPPNPNPNPHFARALRVRGYPAAFIRAAFTTVRYSDRAQYLRPRKPLAPDPTRSPFAFVCPHSPPQETTSIPSYVGAGRVWSRGFVHPGHHPGVPTGVDPSHHASAKAPPKTAQVLAGRLLRQVTWPLLSFRSHRMCAWVFFPNRWVSSTVWGHRVACWCQ